MRLRSTRHQLSAAFILSSQSVTLLFLAIVSLFLIAMQRVAAPLSDIVTAAHRVGDGDFSVRLGEQGLPWLHTRMLARLVEDLRTSAHAESGTLSLQKEPTDLVELIADVASSVPVDAGERAVRIETRVPSDLPLVNVDPHRMQEVLWNLLSNALRHAPHGSVVSVACERDSHGVVIRVHDHGPGIPPGDLMHIFDRFYKGRDSSGSGLGLTIARTLVEAHGGRLSAANRSEGGTVFTVTLPLGGDGSW